MKKVNRLLTTSVLVAILMVCASAQTKKPTKVVRREIIATVTGTYDSPALAPDVQRRLDTFTLVWSTIRDYYFDPTYSNLNWNSIRSEYEPQVKSAKTDAELYKILNTMLGRLNRSHLAIIPPEVFEAIEAAKREVKAREKINPKDRGHTSPDKLDIDTDDDEPAEDASTRYGIGVELGLINDRFVITRMDPNSAAEYVGLRRGYIIDKVNGVSLQEMLGRILAYNTARSISIKQFIPAEIVTWMLNGKKDSYVDVSYLDENDQSKEVQVRREPLRDRALVILPNLPEQRMSFDARSLDERTGYIRFNLFAVPIIEKFCGAIGEFRSKEQLVIDLRGNIGGVLAVIPTLAGMLTTDSIDLGTSIYRSRTEPLKALSKAKNFKGRIIVLVDDRTASAAEMFALSLRENGRALIVGQHTAGEALPSITVKLPTGAVFEYPFANYRSASGAYIEGVGIEPDRAMPADRKTLLAGKDAQLDLAMSTFADAAAFAGLKSKIKPSDESTAKSGGLGYGSGQADEPPPPPKPKPLPSTSGSGLGNGSGTGAAAKSAPKEMRLTALSSPPPAAKREFPPGHDAASNKYIADFLQKIGGRDVVKAVGKYAAAGEATLRPYGTSLKFHFQAFRDGSDKYSELYDAGATGEIREVFGTKTHFVQADYGVDMDLPYTPDLALVSLFSPVVDLASADELYPSLSYTGSFDREGRKAAVVEGKTKDGIEIALAFDVETGLLVNVTRRYLSISFGDYRKVGAVMLPFKIDREGIGGMSLEEVKINTPIDPTFFSRKQRCFDKAN